jgi:hypothetical protein
MKKNNVKVLYQRTMKENSGLIKKRRNWGYQQA